VVLAASVIKAMLIVLRMEAGSTPESSADFYQTTQGNNPEDSYLPLR
jgi:hypothetical protein